MGGCKLPRMGGTELRSSARVLPTKPFLPGFAFFIFRCLMTFPRMPCSFHEWLILTRLFNFDTIFLITFLIWQHQNMVSCDGTNVNVIGQ